MKLVRSKIPEIISQEGRTVVSHLADPGETWALLRSKVQEETQELLGAESRREIIEEIVDLLEVLEAMQRSLSAFDEVQKVKAFKLESRGPFENVVLHPPYHGTPAAPRCGRCSSFAPAGRDLCLHCESLSSFDV